MGKIRIIGGIHRSRQLNVLDEDGLRPTLDRVKETLFNWLGQDLTGLKCLDLFTGSGSLAFEAISRNATEVVMIEKNSLAYKQLEKNKKILNASNCTILNQDALNFLSANQTQKFDVVFIDPPFNSNLLSESLKLIRNVINHKTLIYVEYRDKVDLSQFQIIKQKKAGVVNFALLQQEE